MSEPKVILLCGSGFAIPAMQEMIFFRQLAAVAIPEHCEEMIENAQVLLTGTGIPIIVLQKKTMTQKLTEAIETYAIDTGLMLTFSYRLPASLYTQVSKGFYNVHPGPLPAYRGVDPVFQQIKNREKNAGVTIHKVDDTFDTGPVVIDEMIRIEQGDTYGILNEKLSFVAAKLVRTLLKLLSFDVTIPSRVQDESKAKYYKKQGSEDILIQWDVMDAANIIALINACNPWNKGAVTKLNYKVIRLLEAYRIDTYSGTGSLPGTILSISEQGLIIAVINNQAICVKIIYINEGFLLAQRLQQFGVMPGARFSSV